MLVSNAANFRWRDGGLRRARAPAGRRAADHRRRLPPARAPDHAARLPPRADGCRRGHDGRGGRAALEPGAPGQVVDVYAWARELAMRIAMRALLGLDPDDRGTGALAAHEFERALSFYGTDYALRILRGPGSPWWRLQRARAVLDRIIYGEIERRRREGTGHEDMLGMLMAATDEDGSRLSDLRGARPGDDAAVRGPRHLHLHDLVPALRAGAQPATSWLRCWPSRTRAWTARRRGGPGGRHAAPGHGARRDAAPLPARVDRAAAGGRGLRGGGRAGARRQLRELLLVGEPPAARRVPRPGGLRLRAVRARAPRPRCPRAPTCRSAAARARASACASARWRSRRWSPLSLQRFRLELLAGRTMTVRQMPTLSPRGGLRMTVRERGVPVASPAVPSAGADTLA